MMKRRDFITRAATLTTVAALTGPRRLRAAAPANYKAAIIGHTGRGNYGHGMEMVFHDRPGIEIVGLADPDAAGRARAQERVRAQRTYADYREMLEKERPQLVSVAPRWTDQHHAMVKAALEIGAHVYCEKPFTTTLAEADELLALAARGKRRVAVAHQGRNAPATLWLKQQLDAGFIGELLEIRVHGKQDRRAGGEDLVVLGTHQFDIVRFLAGDAQWCTARVLQGGREITAADARAATENIGPIVGDEIEALFALSRGVNVHYTSRARQAAVAGPWGMELVGTKGRARLLNDVFTDVFTAKQAPMGLQGQTTEWVPWKDPAAAAGNADRSFHAANRRVVDDWLAAIAGEREPVCNAHAAMKSLEMIHAIFAAGVSRGRVELPLRHRAHPLAA